MYNRYSDIAYIHMGTQGPLPARTASNTLVLLFFVLSRPGALGAVLVGGVKNLKPLATVQS